MFKGNYFCHSVSGIAILVAMLFSSTIVQAQGPLCSSLFHNRESRFETRVFTESENTLRALREGVLAEIRTANPSKDHLAFFAEQVPLILTKLEVKFGEMEVILLKRPNSTEQAYDISKRKELSDEIIEIHDKLIAEANQRLKEQNVTYEWYMGFFLKALVFNDAAGRLVSHQGSETLGIIKRRLDMVLGNSKVFYSTESAEMTLYSTFSKELSSLKKDSYFARHLPEYAIIPVLFKLKDSDVIEAEGMGSALVSIRSLEEAAKQADQAYNHVQNFRDITMAAKWKRYHNKIAVEIKGDSKLEALYTYILSDAGLQIELLRRFNTAKTSPVEQVKTNHSRVLTYGHRAVFVENTVREAAPTVAGVKPSQFLYHYFKSHQAAVNRIASPETVSEFLVIISRIEQEGLATH